MKLPSSFRTTSLSIFGLLSIASALLVSCTKEAVQPTADPSAKTELTTAPSYSGQALFQGIFLVEGKVAASIPYLASMQAAIAKNNRLNPQRELERHLAADRLTQVVGQLDPGYFAELEAAVSSQNFNRIEAAIRKGAALQKTALLSLIPAQKLNQQRSQLNELLKKLDVSKYDFQQPADFERFLADAKALSATNAGGVAQMQESVVIDSGVIIAYCLLCPFAMADDLSIVIYFGNNLDSNGQVSDVMRKKADLEKDQFIRDLAFLNAPKR